VHFLVELNAVSHLIHMSDVVNDFDIVTLTKLFKFSLVSLESLAACQVRVHMIVDLLDDDAHIKPRIRFKIVLEADRHAMKIRPIRQNSLHDRLTHQFFIYFVYKITKILTLLAGCKFSLFEGILRLKFIIVLLVDPARVI